MLCGILNLGITDYIFFIFSESNNFCAGAKTEGTKVRVIEN